MYRLDKCILVTNNDRVYLKYRDEIKCILLDNYEDVLIKVRDMIYDRHILLTHPQASSLKPNQTPYRSVMVYPKEKEDEENSYSYMRIGDKTYYRVSAKKENKKKNKKTKTKDKGEDR